MTGTRAYNPCTEEPNTQTDAVRVPLGVVESHPVKSYRTHTHNMNDSAKINLLVFRDGPLWVAQGVEYDLVACANTLDELEYETHRVVALHCFAALEFGEEPFASLPPAPEEVREAFYRARALEFRPARFFTETRPLPTPRFEAKFVDSRPKANNQPLVPV